MIAPNPFELLDSRLSRIEGLLIELKHRPKNEAGTGDDDLMTVPQAASFLSLSVATIYAMTSRGELPFMKRAKRCYFSKSELIKYLKGEEKRAGNGGKAGKKMEGDL